MADLVLSTRLIADAKGFREEIKTSRRDLDRLAGSSGKTGRAARGAGRSLGRMGGDARRAGTRLRRLNDESRNLTAGLGGLRTMVAALGLGLLARSIVRTNVEFQTLSASLRTVTGSAEAAGSAFAALDKFAAETPFQLQEVVGAFIKLKARGLDPSEAALRSYGNTASAMGKSLDQVIEAVADAATGEFERLKEFGIRASAQGDQVSFTFRGVTTTVGRNAAEIEGYLRRIGEVEFAGAMDEQMKTLGGAFSNLSDNVSRLFRAIGEGGLSAGVIDLSRAFTEAAGRGQSFARSIGSVLGSAVSLAADTFRLFERHARLALSVLAGIAAVKTATALRAITAAALGASRALLALAATPLGALALAIGVVAAALVGFRDELVRVQGRQATVMDFVVAAAWDYIAEHVGAAWDMAERFAGGPWGRMIIDAARSIGGAFKAMFNTAAGVFATIGDVARIGASVLADAFDAAIDYVLERFRDLGRSARALFAGEFAAAAELASEALSKSFKSGFSDARTEIEQALDENFGRDWLGDWMAVVWREAGDIATPAIDDVAARAAARYRARLAAAVKPTPATPAAGDGAGTGTGTTSAPAHDAKVLDDLRKRQLALLPVYDRLTAEADAWRDQALEGLNAQALGYEDFRAQVEDIYGGMLAEAREEDLRSSKRWQDGVTRGLRDVAGEAEDTAAAMESGVKSAFSGMEDALVGFVRTGKLSFSGLVDSILADIARMTIRQSITGPLAGALGDILKSIFTPGLPGPYDGAAPGTAPLIPVHRRPLPPLRQVRHGGGIAGALGGVRRAVPPEVFAHAPRYHRGGIAGMLRPDEVPIIAQTGEAILPRGAAITPPAVNIRFVNQGTPQREVDREVRFDGARAVVTIFLADLENHGPVSQGFEGAYGIRRAGI